MPKNKLSKDIQFNKDNNPIILIGDAIDKFHYFKENNAQIDTIITSPAYQDKPKQENKIGDTMKHKTLGQVFTPDWIVEEILDSSGFSNNNLINKKIIDPACGDGAFLKIIVSRIIDTLLNKKYPKEKIKEYLEDYVYGIEIDEIEFNKCLSNLNHLIENKLDRKLNINWKIFKDNTLTKYKEYMNFFDFVVGNPPYIRIHNLDKKTRDLLKKEFIFSNGTIDIYISFFELGFKLLNEKGILGYITPNSYLHNSSYVEFRKYLKEKRVVKRLTDFKANKVFKNFSTYTAITIINFFEKKDYFVYQELMNNKIQEVNKVNYNNLEIKDWSFSGNKEMDFLKNLYSNTNKKVSDFFDVQYGFATLRDKIYIGEVTKEKDTLVLFNNKWIEKKILYKVVKGSTYKGNEKEIKHILFPYKRQANRFIPIPEEELKKYYSNAYNYLLENKEELLKRDIDEDASWYEFGRSQGIQTSYNEKIVLSTLVNHRINFYKLKEDIFVYSGIFIIKKKKEINWDIITNILSSEDFYKYIQITGKDFSGGYKSVTSKQIKNYPTNELNHQKIIINSLIHKEQ
jgi:adenine-specific DNA-methyltransferase